MNSIQQASFNFACVDNRKPINNGSPALWDVSMGSRGCERVAKTVKQLQFSFSFLKALTQKKTKKSVQYTWTDFYCAICGH